MLKGSKIGNGIFLPHRCLGRLGIVRYGQGSQTRFDQSKKNHPSKPFACLLNSTPKIGGWVEIPALRVEVLKRRPIR